MKSRRKNQKFLNQKRNQNSNEFLSKKSDILSVLVISCNLYVNLWWRVNVEFVVIILMMNVSKMNVNVV